jgi:hypothetical protein
MGMWRYNSTILDLGIDDGVSSHLHVPVALPAGKEPLVPIGQPKPGMEDVKKVKI